MLLTNSSERHGNGYGIGRWKDSNVVEFDEKEQCRKPWLKLPSFPLKTYLPSLDAVAHVGQTLSCLLSPPHRVEM